MKRGIYLSVATAMIALAPSVASAATVFGNTSAAQLIGSLAAGQAYTVTATGIIALCGSCNAGTPLTFNPDGTAATPAQDPYTAFNSGPKDYDPSVGTGAYGAYGAGVYLGALYGSFTAAPTAGDLFLIGYGTTIAAGAARTLYGVINDTSYGDNPSTAFAVTLDRAGDVGGVPEPATWAMMMLGFGGVGYMLRRRQKVVARIRFA